VQQRPLYTTKPALLQAPSFLRPDTSPWHSCCGDNLTGLLEGRKPIPYQLQEDESKMKWYSSQQRPLYKPSSAPGSLSSSSGPTSATDAA